MDPDSAPTLSSAQELERLDARLTSPGPDGRPASYDAHDRAGTPRAYVDDVARALELAGPDVARALRYALIHSSVCTSWSLLSVQVTEALVRHGIWSPERAREQSAGALEETAPAAGVEARLSARDFGTQLQRHIAAAIRLEPAARRRMIARAISLSITTTEALRPEHLRHLGPLVERLTTLDPIAGARIGRMVVDRSSLPTRIHHVLDRLEAGDPHAGRFAEGPHDPREWVFQGAQAHFHPPLRPTLLARVARIYPKRCRAAIAAVLQELPLVHPRSRRGELVAQIAELATPDELQVALRTLTRIGDTEPRARTLLELLEVVPHEAARQRQGLVLEVLREIQAFPDAWLRASGAARLLRFLEPQEQGAAAEKALHDAGEITEGAWRREALSHLVPHLALAQHSQALGLAQAIEHPDARAMALRDLAVESARRGSVPAALAALDDVAAPFQVEAFVDAALALARGGHLTEAVYLATLGPSEGRDRAVVAVLPLLALSRPDEARQIARTQLTSAKWHDTIEAILGGARAPRVERSADQVTLTEDDPRELWTGDFLDELASRPRPELVATLGELAPQLLAASGPGGVLDVAQDLLRTARWWA